MKEIIGLIAVLLTFVGYAPYIRDIIKGKTHPHAYSWFVWGMITISIFAIQANGGAGPGAYITLAAGTVSFIVFGLGLKYGKQDITKTDTLFFVSALVATGIWLFADAPLLSMILLITIDRLLGFAPTIRKSWNKPYSETLAMYQVGAFRHGLSILALQTYSVVTSTIPVSWVSSERIF